MLIAQIIAFLIVGAITGVLSGLFGIGGGLIFIPFQIIIYALLDAPTYLQMKMAVGTSLCATACTTFASARAHSKHGAVKWDLIYKIAAGIILGALLGAFVARIMPGKVLEMFFGCMLCIVAVYLFFFVTPHDHETGHIPSFVPFNLVGLGVGTTSAMLGISGGIMMVPILIFFHLSMRKAVGTASAMGFLLSIVGAIGFLFPGLAPISYPYTLGYIYLPAFIPLAIGSVLTAKWGALLSHSLPLLLLKRILSIVLLLIGILMICR